MVKGSDLVYVGHGLTAFAVMTHDKKTMPDSSTYDAAITVWVVEDDALFRETVYDVVDEAEGMVCAHAFGTCEGALEALEADAAPNVILMDLGLPGFSGIDGIRHIRARSPITEIVVLTVHEDTDKIFNAICAGASGYLLKPSSAEQISAAVRMAYTGGAAINPRIARKVLTMFAQTIAPPQDYGLTRREKEVLECMVDGMTKKGMAEKFHLSFHTIDRHIRNVYAKLHVHSRGSAVAKAVKERLI